MNEYSVKKMSEYPVNPSPLSEDLIPTITVEGGKFVNRNIEFSKLKGDKGDTGPQGEPGDDGNTGASGKAATVEVGSVSTGPAGSSATVENTGDEYDAVLDFTIPKGDKGDQGVVQSVNGKSQEDVVLDTDDIADTATNRYTNDTDVARLADTSGANTGDQDLSGLATDAELTAGLATKEPTITAGTTSQYYRGDKTWQTLNTTAVGIPNVNNTSDMDKPVSTAQGVALNLKEDLSNKSTTTTLGTSNTLYPTQNAVKTYVDTQNALYVLKAGDTSTGTQVMPSLVLNSSTNSISRDVTNDFLRISGGTVSNGAVILLNGSTSSSPSTGIFRTGATTIAAWTATGFIMGGTGVAPTHTLTLPSTATGIALYNTVDQTTNYERVRQYWSGNVWTLTTEAGGTGNINRALTINAAGNSITLQAATGAMTFARSGSTGLGVINNFTATFTSATISQSLISYSPTINQSGTAGYTAILANVTETATGSGAKNLIDLQVGGSSRFRVTNDGSASVANALAVSGWSSFGGTGPSALVDAFGSTAARASIRVRTGVAPTSPNTGDIYSDGTNIFCYLAGSWKQLS